MLNRSNPVSLCRVPMFLLVAQLIMVLTVASSAQELSSGRVAASVSISPAELGDPASLRDLRIGDRVLVRDVPTGDDTVALDLQRFSVTSPETRFVVGRSGRPLEFDPSDVALFRGGVVGRPGSRVFLAATPGAIEGYVELAAGDSGYVLSSGADGGAVTVPRPLTILRRPRGGATLPPSVPFCETFTSGVPREPRPPTRSDPLRARRQIELAVDTDYEYYSLFNNLNAAAAYIVQVYGAVSDIYIRDVNAHVTLAFVRLWDDPNDLYNEPSPLDALMTEWQDNMQAVSRDTVQLFSGRRNLPAGGVAYLGEMCTEFGYSWAGYAQGRFLDPDIPHFQNGDILVTAHELGHICNALHTHSDGLDTCNDENSQPRRGTIMSYCGQTFTGGDANMDLSFHAYTQAVMETFLAQAPCIAIDCNANGTPDSEDISTGESLDTNRDGVPDECQDCDGDGTLDPVEIAGPSNDINGNGVPDECEQDCNGNGVPDDHDIYGPGPVSQDLNADNVPDECQADCDNDNTLDYLEIINNMSLDLNRNAKLDACEDCDSDGQTDLAELNHAHNAWVAALDQTRIREYLANFGTLTDVSDNASLSSAADVIITPDRRVLVSSAGNDRVLEYNVNGGFVRTLVAAGSGGLSSPAQMLIAPSGTLLVVSRGSNGVKEYNLTSGAFIRNLVATGSGGLTAPFGVAVGPNGHLFVTSNDNRVLEYDVSTGAFIRVLVSAGGNGGLSQPRGILFLPSGNLLVASYGTNAILEYNGTSGAFVRQFSVVGTATVLTLDQPWCLRLGPEGDVYCSRSHELGLLPSGDPNDGDTDGEQLHLTNARIYQFNVKTGWFERAYIMGVDSGMQMATGFDFVPDTGVDCNFNQRQDSCDIASGASLDVNGNGVPDECEPCPGDTNGDRMIDNADLQAILDAWARSFGQAGYDPNADLNDDYSVDNVDLQELLDHWADVCP